MNVGYFLACVNMMLALGASLGYAFTKDWRSAIYWLAAAVLTASVTLKK